jgi:hypothetical protein
MKFNVDYSIFSNMAHAPVSEGTFRIEASDEEAAEILAEEEIERTDPAYDPRIDPYMDITIEDASVYVRHDPEPDPEYPEVTEWRAQVKGITKKLVSSQLRRKKA